jgi:hypothetical protein
MKKEILSWLKNDRTFETGRDLYMKHGKSLSFKKQLNMQGHTPLLMGTLIEELRKIAELLTSDITDILSRPVQVNLIPEKPESKQPPRLLEVPEMVKKAIRLRDDFPFLKEKDCPDEFKIIVADMLTAYDTYRETHPKLFEDLTPEEALKLTSDVVENYIENREIWDELIHFKEKGEILGNHPIFEETKWAKELESMESGELVKRKDALYNAITRTKKKITDGDRPDLTAEREESIASKEKEMTEVLRILALRGIKLD